MKKILKLLMAIILLSGFKAESQIDANYVIEKYREKFDNIRSIEYNVRKIDTFSGGKTILDNTGMALIEKDESDEIFGFSFYGKRDDVPKEYIYDSGNGFVYYNSEKTYEVESNPKGFLGYPGGQLVPRNIFHLDSVYKEVTLTETESSYLLTYELENDTVFNVSDIKRIYELDKNDLTPVMFKWSAMQTNGRYVLVTNFKDVKINEDVALSISELKKKLNNTYTLKQPEKAGASQFLGKKLPDFKLPDLFDPNKIVNLNWNKPTLIDFWEFWCGPCIASFSKVESINKRYSSQLDVIGISSDDPEKARQLVDRKGATFQTLVGNDELQKQFNVNSFPRYFLVDKNGNVLKEYYGFSEQIEKDIKELLLM